MHEIYAKSTFFTYHDYILLKKHQKPRGNMPEWKITGILRIRVEILKKFKILLKKKVTATKMP